MREGTWVVHSECDVMVDLPLDAEFRDESTMSAKIRIESFGKVSELRVDAA